jgi:hypothetical protein
LLARDNTTLLFLRSSSGYDVSRARGTPEFGTSLPFDLVDQTAKW